MSTLSRFVALLLTVAAGACAVTNSRDAVPSQFAETATVDGFADVRLWGDAVPKKYKHLLERAEQQRNSLGGASARADHFLALSGGGSDGAFGAGLLVGWTKQGTRPQFEVVTGISTGALIAPFAFLGPHYDGELTKLYTHYGSSDILSFNWLSGLLGGPAVAENAPLKELIRKFISPNLVEEVASEYRRGRRLFIGTTNLDAQRPVIWDMGAIAASGRSGALDLFRQVLLASASIPIAFPPVRISVEHNNNSYQELHADGSITAPLFFWPSGFALTHSDNDRAPQQQSTLYVIRNGRIHPEYLEVKDNLIALTERAFTTMSKNQAAGEVLRLCLNARRNGVTFRLAYIPQEFDAESQEMFDPSYMTRLFETGHQFGKDGNDWKEGSAICEAGF